MRVSYPKAHSTNSALVLRPIRRIILVIVLGTVAGAVFGCVTSTRTPLPTRNPPPPIPTNTPLPSPTSTRKPTPSRTPVPTLRTSLVACLENYSSLNAREGPGINYRVIASASRDQCFRVDGRNFDASWVRAPLEGRGYAWLSAGYLEFDGSPLLLPFRQSPPPPPPPPPPPLSPCHPSYEGACLGIGIGDYDCGGGRGNGPNYVWVTVRVVGYDEFGLDGDGDGWGCE